jgi:4-amino-4-deoxy-L-arabinose transferase-like glycosyltransferase
MIRSDQEPQSADGRDPFDSLRRHVLEFAEYASYLSGLKSARFKAKITKLVLRVVLGVACALLTAVAGAVAVYLVLQGLVDLLAWATGWLWLGELTVGVGVLVILSGGAALGAAMIRSRSRRRNVRQFEARQEKQRVRFDRDIDQAAREQIRGPVSG